ncbi:GCN5 family N-acetyltransferase [Pseudomonas asuensis]|uniref:GCN5 family N-acetyltransferase n=1 Tax=Pseudomonas asuensis TaxID=1825787 RepID=A0ABQ2GSS5_9PSED|nr:GCN5 family N-acetyltransferase [Pseudomonas asuensis]
MLNADPEVREHFPSLLDRASSEAECERIQGRIEQHGWGFWAVELKETREFIGFTGLNTPEGLPCSPCVEIGWRLAKPYWGRGYASEAAREALRIGFEQLKLDEIVAFTALSNYRSRAVMERLGMQDAHEEFDHPRVPAGHPVRRHCLYRLTYEDWQSRLT